MLRRRRPIIQQHDDITPSDAAVSAAVSVPKGAETDTALSTTDDVNPNPFDSVSNEILQLAFDFLPNDQLPQTVCSRFFQNSIEVKKQKAQQFFKHYLENKLELDLQNKAPEHLIFILKTICDYHKYCITNKMNTVEQRARQAVLALMIMQVMAYCTRQNIIRYLLPNGVMHPIVFPDGDADVVEEHIPLSANEINTFKQALMQANILSLLKTDQNGSIDLSGLDIHSRIQTVSQAMTEIPSHGLLSLFMFCVPVNPYPPIIKDVVAHTLSRINTLPGLAIENGEAKDLPRQLRAI